MSRFMDPTTDFGFKKLFGDEANKDLTMSFLNDLLELDSPLVDLGFANLEQLPEAPEQRIGIYDLLCHDAQGNSYLVEMQKSRIAYVKDRMVYYSTFPMAAQAKKGSKRSYYQYQPSLGNLYIREAANAVYGTRAEEVAAAQPWNYALKDVYCIAILDYPLNGSTAAVNYNSIRNDRPPHELFYEKLKFVTVELPLFDPRKPEYSLDRHRNRWLFFLSFAADLEEVPEIFDNDKIIQKAFRIAEIVNLTWKERQLYERNLKQLRDAYAILETSHEDGLAKGMAEGMAKGIAEGMAKGMVEGKMQGKIEGRLEGKIESLLSLFSQKLGPIPAEIGTAILALKTPERIDMILSQFMQINNWEELQKLLSPQDGKIS